MCILKPKYLGNYTHFVMELLAFPPVQHKPVLVGCPKVETQIDPFLSKLGEVATYSYGSLSVNNSQATPAINSIIL